MFSQLRKTALPFGLLAVCWGCSAPSGSDAPASGGGATGGVTSGGTFDSTGGVAALGGSISSGGTSQATGGSAEPACGSEAPVRDAESTETWPIQIDLFVGTSPIVLGEDVTFGDTTYQFTEAKFYLAEPTLARMDGTTVPAAFLNAAREPSPYNVHLVDASEPASLQLAVAAPPGPYATLELGFGLPHACNLMDPTVGSYPLSLDTGMFWAWGTQYKFLLLHGSLTAGGSTVALAQELGFDVSYKRMSWPLTEGSAAELAPAKLRVALHEFVSPPEGETFEATNHTFVPEWALNKLDTTIFQLSPLEATP